MFFIWQKGNKFLGWLNLTIAFAIILYGIYHPGINTLVGGLIMAGIFLLISWYCFSSLNTDKKLTTNSNWPLIVVMVTVVLFGVYLLINYSDQTNKKAQFQNDFSTLQNLNNKLKTVFDEVNSIPSSQTRSKQDWDVYYKGELDKIDSIIINSGDQKLTDTGLQNYYNDITSTATDLKAYVSQLSSGADTIAQISTDKQYISYYGATQDYTNRLNADQATLASQTKDQDTLYSKVSGDFSTLNQDKSNLNAK